MGMSAAADDPRTAAARVSAVATIGYVAFLAGPPLIGFLGEEFGLLRGLLVVFVFIIVAGLVSGAARERTPAAIADDHRTARGGDRRAGAADGLPADGDDPMTDPAAAGGTGEHVRPER